MIKEINAAFYFSFCFCFYLYTLDDTVHYVGFLLGPVEGFGPWQRKTNSNKVGYGTNQGLLKISKRCYTISR